MKWVVGIDEVGRGPLAGPVYVGAVIMRAKDYKTWKPHGLTDSKKMTAKAREKWALQAKELHKQGVIAFAIGKASATTIDSKGITAAIKKCINRALTDLDVLKLCDGTDRVRILLDGGLKASSIYTSQRTIVRGDASEKIISLASVIAKVARDDYMIRLSKKYPLYKWHANKGYGTKKHIVMIRKYGLSPHHRKTFTTRIIDKN
ncbi:MAG TPA: ribonuclease HII [Candidatus Paceibacterota bacterium]|nr:ribonuclease HII [Candidatus Paceibacterota bacterium]